MSVLAKSLFLLSLALYVSALATPRVARNAFEHHRLAARAAVPVSVAEAVSAPPAVTATPRRLRKRANGRCKAPASSSAASSTPVSSSAPASIVNVAPSPSLASSSIAAPATSATPEATSSSEAPAPTSAAPQTSAAPAPTSSSQAPATTSASSSGDSSNSPSFLIGTQTGQGTFYETGLGACGITNTDTDYIAAVSHLLFDAFPGYNGVNPNSNPICGKKVTATYQGKSVTVAITDRCTGCALTDLDFSPSAFTQLADEAVGRLSGMTWVWDS